MSILGELVGAAGSVRHSGEPKDEDRSRATESERRAVRALRLTGAIIVSGLFALGLPLVLF